MSMRTVAVVLHFRTPAMTLRCLRATLDAGVTETVLVDNSQDEGRSVTSMQEQIALLRGCGLILTVLSPARNLGFAAGVNLAIHHLTRAGPSRVLLLNSDALISRDALQHLEDALEAGMDAAGPQLVAALEAKGASVMPGYHRWLALHVPSDVHGAVPYISGACMLLSERIARSPLLDETFFFYGEDVELAQRLHLQRARIAYLPQARVLHPPSSSARNSSLFYEYHVLRGHWLLAFRLVSSWPGRMLAVLGRLLILPARAVLRAIRSKSWVPIAAFVFVVMDLVRRRMRDLTPPAHESAGTDDLPRSRPSRSMP